MNHCVWGFEKNTRDTGYLGPFLLVIQKSIVLLKMTYVFILFVNMIEFLVYVSLHLVWEIVK